MLVAVGRVRPWSWPEPAALVAGWPSPVIVAVWGIVASVPLLAAARVADRSLGTHDAFVTALELGGRTDDFAVRVAQRGDEPVARPHREGGAAGPAQVAARHRRPS